MSGKNRVFKSSKTIRPVEFLPASRISAGFGKVPDSGWSHSRNLVQPYHGSRIKKQLLGTKRV